MTEIRNSKRFEHSKLRILDLFRISGTTPGNRHPEKTPELSIFVFRVSAFSAGSQKRRPPIIGRTCAFDAKIYKIVDSVFDVNACEEGNKKIFKLFYFCFQLPSFLIDLLEKNLPILTRFPGVCVAESGRGGGFLG